MRIAMLSWETLHSIAAGGVATHVTELSAALARAGHEVHIFTRIAPDQAEYDKVFGVHYHRVPYPGHHDLIDDANNMCRAFVDRLFATEQTFGHFDVVHAHDWLAANAMIWIKQGRGHQTVFTVHSTEYARCGNSFPDGPPQRIRDQERAGCYWADHVIAVSETTRQEAMWMYELPDWKSSVVFNGVSAARFKIPVDEEAVRRRYAIGPLDPVVLFCGRLEWQKGPDLLIETLPAVLDAHPRTKFLFVGDGSLRAHVERRAHEMGCGDAIRMAGKQKDDELVRLFRIADLVAVPSRNEPFGIVVLEAWSAGKPVVATHCGGPAEYVWHEVTGLKVYPNPNSICWGIVTTFNDFGWARWMGQRGREAVSRQFSWERVAEETLAVYRKVRGEETAEAQPPIAPAPVTRQDGQDDPLATAVGAAETTEDAGETEPAEEQVEPSPEIDAPNQSERPLDHAGDAPPSRPEPALVHATVHHRPTSGAPVPEAFLNACEQVLTDAGCHPYRDREGFAVHGEAGQVLSALSACHRAIGHRGNVEIETRTWSQRPDRRDDALTATRRDDHEQPDAAPLPEPTVVADASQLRPVGPRTPPKPGARARRSPRPPRKRPKCRADEPNATAATPPTAPTPAPRAVDPVPARRPKLGHAAVNAKPEALRSPGHTDPPPAPTAPPAPKPPANLDPVTRGVVRSVTTAPADPPADPPDAPPSPGAPGAPDRTDRPTSSPAPTSP